MSLGEAKAAVDADPLSAFARVNEAQALLALGHVETAMRQARSVVDLDPSYFLGYAILAGGFAVRGEYPAAVAALREARRHAEGDPTIEGLLGWTLAVAGNRDEARTIAEQLEARRREGYSPASPIAWVHVGLGDHERAYGWLDRAYEERDGLVCWINSIWVWDSLRTEPRFQAFARRLNLPERR